MLNEKINHSGGVIESLIDSPIMSTSGEVSVELSRPVTDYDMFVVYTDNNTTIWFPKKYKNFYVTGFRIMGKNDTATAYKNGFFKRMLSYNPEDLYHIVVDAYTYFAAQYATASTDLTTLTSYGVSIADIVGIIL